MRLSIAVTIDSVEFTKGVIAGDVSLGGSESAALGLARGLAARGHDVNIFTTKLSQDAHDTDHGGVHWHGMTKLRQWAIFKDWDVAIALRQPGHLQQFQAKFRVLWAQDLMANEVMKNYVMSLAWAYDAVAYVSAYHRKQWEGWLPELSPFGWVTKNGHDAELAKDARAFAVKRPNQIIHISRPERGLLPLLQMWPELRRRNPNAELALCRYSSMYDPDGWGAVCQTFDREVERISEEVGGIRYLGELGKPALYQAIAESAVMWYPGVASFGETSCIAAIEAQACGTPFVGSYKGALAETIPSGVLIHGDAETDAAYHEASISAVLHALDDCRGSTFNYWGAVAEGLQHVADYSYERIAAEWEAFLLGAFKTRYEAQKAGILRRLDHDDDLVTAKIVAAEMPETDDSARIVALANRVIAGEEHTATHYAKYALDTSVEVEANSTRHTSVIQAFDGCKRILDVACGNGAFAIRLAQADPERHITAIDFSENNIQVAQSAAESYGVAQQITFVAAPAWDMAAQQPSWWLKKQGAGTFDGAFCGEFMEHVENTQGLIAAVERTVKHQGRIVWTVPMGPLTQLCDRHAELYRSHVQHFRPADLDALFGEKGGYQRLALPWYGRTGRGETVGNWLVSYRHDGPAGQRDMNRRMLLRPYDRISAGIICNDAIDLRRCLSNIWDQVDEIVIGDTGARADDLDAICKEFPRKTRVVPVGDVSSLQGGFSEARNVVMHATTGEWFFWIDSDEILCGAQELGKYLDGPVFRGYVIPQNHLYMDAAMGTDTPTRVFRKGPDIQFYGCVHEQPQMGDCNGDIQPALQLADVQIAHTGYLHEGIRREKALYRNLPLLVRDQHVFPDRLLGKLLVLRDHANLALWDRQQYNGALTEKAKYHYGQVVALFEEYFFDPAHKYHAIGRPFYESALQCVATSIEVEIAITGAVGGINGHRAKPVRAWVRSPEDVRTLLTGRIDAMLEPLKGQKPLDVEPVTVEVRA